MSELIVKSTQNGKKFDRAEDVAELVEQIRNKEDQVGTLNLEGNSYGIEPLKEIGNSLQTCHNLKHLLLNDMFTSRLKNEIPKALRYLLGGVQASRAQIITLNLNDNAIGPVTMPELLPFLKSDQFSSLRHLYLNNCGLGIKGGRMLASVLPCLENLTELVIGRNRLEIDGVLEISLTLSELNKLERLELPQNGTKEKAIIALCQALKHNPNLKILNLNDNVLSSTANKLADALKGLEHLEVLNLGDCLLKTEGAIIILSALNSFYRDKWCSRIKEINLSGNEIGQNSKDIIIVTIETILETRKDATDKFKIDLSVNNLGGDLVDELKNHFGSVIQLTIEDDQGSDDNQEDIEDQDETEDMNESTENNIKLSLFKNPKQLQAHIESQYKDLNALCRRFFQVSTQGFEPSEKKIKKQALKEIDALIKVGKKNFLKNEFDFSLLNNLLVACGLIKGEDKTISPRKEADLSGAILALARVAREFSSDSNQKRCIKYLLSEKVKEDRYQNIKHVIYSLFYSF